MTEQSGQPAAPSSPRIILFPGMGADPRMFAPQRAAIPHLETPAWIPHVPGESLREYAHRFSATLGIREPAVLGGVSMGGMIALEMARIVPARCVVLIASCRAPAAVSPLLQMAERLSRLAPDILLDKGRMLAPLFVGTGGSISRDDKRLLVRMAQEQPLDFLRWAGRAILEWPGCDDSGGENGAGGRAIAKSSGTGLPPGASGASTSPRRAMPRLCDGPGGCGGVPVHHIHGDRDWAIPARRTRPDQIVRRGCHVLNLSHPDQVNAFITAAAAG